MRCLHRIQDSRKVILSSLFSQQRIPQRNCCLDFKSISYIHKPEGRVSVSFHSNFLQPGAISNSPKSPKPAQLSIETITTHEIINLSIFNLPAYSYYLILSFNMALRNVIIIGAGGHLGPSILSTFRADSRFNVSVLSRVSSTSVFPENVKVHRVGDEYPDDEILSAFKGQDAVISTIATASAKQQERLIDIAIKAGVKRFVPSEFGSDTRNPNAMAILPQYFGGKQATVDYLIGKEKEGLTWSSFVTGPFFELCVFPIPFIIYL